MRSTIIMILTLSCALLGVTHAQSKLDPSKLAASIVAVRAQIPAQARTSRALGTERFGSGVVIDAKGLIITVGYLILEAAEVQLKQMNGRVVPAEILAYDHRSGFGLLRALGSLEAPAMSLGDSSRLLADSPALVMSFGQLQPVTVTSRRTFAGYWEYLLDGAIFTQPPHPTFAGAALLNQQGKLVGIGSLMVADAAARPDTPGNMFVPIARLLPIMGDLLTHGRSAAPPRPWLGIYAQESAEGLVVSALAAEGPAEAAGVQDRDLIIAVGELMVSTMADFLIAVWRYGDAGAVIPLTVRRAGLEKHIEIHSRDRYDWLRLAWDN